MQKTRLQAVDELITLGKITSAYGIKGWFRVYSYTDPIDNLFQYPTWQLRLAGSETSTDQQPQLLVKQLEAGRKHGKGLVAKLEGIDTPEAIRSLAGAEILVSQQELPQLPAGEFYWSQLLGLKVVNLQQQYFGQVARLLETGANDVLVVKAKPGSLDKQERLIPWIPEQVIQEVNLTTQEIIVDWDADF